MNKRILWISAVVVTVLALSLDAFAQQGGGGRQGGQGRQQGQGGQQGQRQGGQQFAGAFGGGQNAAALLRNAEVVTMLGITAEQTTALSETLRPPQGQGQGGGQQGTPLTPADRRARQNEQWANIGKILKAEQLTKFKDIYFQASVPVVNPNAPADAPAPVMRLDTYVLGAVNLTADQKEKINKILDDAAAATPAPQAPGAQSTPEERASARIAMLERNTKTNDAIKAVLTVDQKKKMDELTAGATALRDKLGLPAPGQRGGQQGQGGRQGGATGDTGNTTYTPGAQSWQPGQNTPTTGNRAGRAGGNFPRNSAN